MIKEPDDAARRSDFDTIRNGDGGRGNTAEIAGIMGRNPRQFIGGNADGKQRECPDRFYQDQKNPEPDWFMEAKEVKS